MYSRQMAEMFPSEDLNQMHYCVNTKCFYNEHLFRPSELEWGEKWCKEQFDLVAVPRCPSCRQWMEEYNDAENS